MTGQLYPTPWRLPPITDRRRGTTPRCLGGCGTATEPGFMTCDECWRDLSPRLRGGLRRWRRLDSASRQQLILDVENSCTAARRRNR